MSKSHYTTLGLSMQPKEADQEGFLHYRENFRDINPTKWAPAERLIAQADYRENFRDINPTKWTPAERLIAQAEDSLKIFRK